MKALPADDISVIRIAGTEIEPEYHSTLFTQTGMHREVTKEDVEKRLLDELDLLLNWRSTPQGCLYVVHNAHVIDWMRDCDEHNLACQIFEDGSVLVTPYGLQFLGELVSLTGAQKVVVQ
jgi:hypothetical protein